MRTATWPHSLLTLALLSCRPVVEPTYMAEPRPPPLWAAPPAREQALIDGLRARCPRYQKMLDLLLAARFADADEEYRAVREAVTKERRREVELNGREPSEELEKCSDDAYGVETHIWFQMGVWLDKGERATSAYYRFEAYFQVAMSETPLREEARRRIGNGGLDHWLAETRTNCDSFWGAMAERCERPSRLLAEIAPGSSQAAEAANNVAETKRLDVELAPHVRAANVLLKARGSLCWQFNSRECQWTYKFPPPIGKDKLEKYGDKLPSDDQKPGLQEKLTTCNLSDEADFCAENLEILPKGACPSYWDTSPATLKLDKLWEAAMARIPEGGRQEYLREQWIYSANNCHRPDFGAPYNVTK